jgi:hypothetical protein
MSSKVFIVNLFIPCNFLSHLTAIFLNYLAAGAVASTFSSAGLPTSAAGAGAGATTAGAASTTGSTLTSSFLPHATRASATKPKTITFFIFFS